MDSFHEFIIIISIALDQQVSQVIRELQIRFHLLLLELFVLPHTRLENGSAGVQELTFTVPLVVFPEADILLAGLLVNVVTESIEFTIAELSLVDVALFSRCSTSKGELTFTFLVIVIPLTNVNVAILVGVGSVSMSLTFLDLTLIGTSSGVGELALAFHDSILPFSFIMMVFLFVVIVDTLGLEIIRPRTSELITILISKRTLTLLIVTDEVSFVRSIDVNALAISRD